MFNIKHFFQACILFLPFLIFGQDPQHYTINGTIKGLSEHNKAVLMKLVPGHMVFDTVDAVNGKFTFSGTSYTPQKAFLYLTHDGTMPHSIALGDRVGVFLENGEISVKSNDSLVNAVIGGTPFNNDQQELVTILKPFEKKVQEMERVYAAATKSGDSLEIATTKMNYQAINVEKDTTLGRFIVAHPKSLVSLLLLRTNFDPSINRAKAGFLFDQLDPALQNSPQGQKFAGMIEKTKMLDIGSEAPNFVANNATGEEVPLKSFRGKYVLLDFWASWCGPCRQENPNVLNAFNKYKDQNFTVVSFSLDDGEDGKSKWLAAVKKDGLPWAQLSDLAGFNSPIAYMYSLKAIPSNFLLDPSGIIVAKNLRGQDLEDKLNEILNKKKG